MFRYSGSLPVEVLHVIYWFAVPVPTYLRELKGWVARGRSLTDDVEMPWWGVLLNFCYVSSWSIATGLGAQGGERVLFRNRRVPTSAYTYDAPGYRFLGEFYREKRPHKETSVECYLVQAEERIREARRALRFTYGVLRNSPDSSSNPNQ